MAYGIEELSEMKVTGPVEGGDMVAKPNEMPVGAAALLSKMQKKNTPGIFKLPQADKEMPSFMKVAAEGVEEQNTANLEDSEIMRIMGTYGVGPEEARRIYDEMIYGYERDEAAIDPTDWRSILKMIESGMSQEEIDSQLAMNEVRNDVKKVEAFAPEGEQLAYISPEEQGILKMLGGSGEKEPVTGIESFRNAYVAGQNMKLGGSTPKGFSDRETKQFQAGQDEKAHQRARTGGKEAISGYQFHDKDNQKRANRAAKHYDKTGRAETIQDYGDKDLLKQIEETKKEKSIIDKAKDTLSIPPSLMMEGADALSDFLKNMETNQVEKLMRSLGTDDKGIGLGNLLRTLEGDPDRQANFFKRYGDEDFMDEILGDVEKEQGFDMELSEEDKFQRFLEKAKAGGGDNFLKAYDPKKYYGSKPGENSADYQKRMREKGVTPKELAQLQKEGKIDFTRSNTMMIEEGRERLAKDSRGNNIGRDRMGGGVPEEVSNVTFKENIDIDPRAGQFNVGGTMKYKDDTRTGGTEMNVPLGRRFAIDKSGKFRGNTPMGLNEAINYATLGGYSQLEPFQEYLTRRRKELGEQPDEYFDEEGNVIYSGQA